MELLELVDIFLRDGCVEEPESLGVSDFSPETLENAGYYLTGETGDFHSYENYIDIFHKKIHPGYFINNISTRNSPSAMHSK